MYIQPQFHVPHCICSPSIARSHFWALSSVPKSQNNKKRRKKFAVSCYECLDSDSQIWVTVEPRTLKHWAPWCPLWTTRIFQGDHNWDIINVDNSMRLGSTISVWPLDKNKSEVATVNRRLRNTALHHCSIYYSLKKIYIYNICIYIHV